MSIFITLCECYLGVEPHFLLWDYFFSASRHNENRTFLVGGLGFQLKDKAPYIDVSLISSNSGWHEGWFYIQGDDIPEHTWAEATPLQFWSKKHKNSTITTMEMVDCVKELGSACVTR